MPKQFQYRNFCFTSFKVEDRDKIHSLNVQYILTGLEICPETEREHLQGYCELKSRLTMDSIKELFGDGSLHIESRKGTQEEAIAYCKADGQWKENGTKKSQGSRGDLDGCRVMAATEGMRAVSRCCSMQQIRVAEKFLEYNEEGRDWKPKVYWLYGASGAGKSREARRLCSELGEDPYVKSTGSKWWNGYDRHTAVIIDDFRDSWWPLTYMLALIDRYEFLVETKGGMRQFVPKLIIITSVKPPSGFYRRIDECSVQLMRRIDEPRLILSESQESEVGGNTITPPEYDYNYSGLTEEAIEDLLP